MANKASRSNPKRIILYALCLLLAVALGVGTAVFMRRSKTKSNLEVVIHYPESTLFTPASYVPDDSYIIRNGIVYSPKENITTVLFLGVDKDQFFDSTQLLGNGGRADTIMLFVFDNDDHTIDVLEVNRDLLTPVDVYDAGDNYMYTSESSLCLQHAYSSSLERGAQLVRSNVSNVLGGIYIDNYCSLTVIGMLKIVETLGGLPVTFDEDLTYIHPLFEANTTQILSPELVNEILRVRDLTEVGSNEQRMSRGTFVMRQAFDTIVGASPFTILKCYMAVAGEDFVTDLDIFTLFRLRNYHLNNIYAMPGEYITGGFHDEFFADNEQLQDILIELLYDEVI